MSLTPNQQDYFDRLEVKKEALDKLFFEIQKEFPDCEFNISTRKEDGMRIIWSVVDLNVIK